MDEELARILRELHTLASTKVSDDGRERSELHVANDKLSVVLVQFIDDHFLGAVLLGIQEMNWFAQEFEKHIDWEAEK